MSAYLQISDLTKKYGRICALNGINLSIERGSITALLGPNGAGKSTLFGCLLGFTLPTAGQIRLENRFLDEAQRGRFGYLAERVGLHSVRDRKVRQLSKGMLQRLGLAIALCGRPQLLILDEPFNGLDPALLDSLQSILREERERGATLLISTHTMSAIEPLASHVAILLQGRLAAFGTVDELRAEHAEFESLEFIYHQIARRGCVSAGEVFA